MNVKVKSTGAAFEVLEGESLLSALKRSGIPLVASCGGKGTCGKCRVRLLDGKADVRGHGKLTSAERASGHVLACMSYPSGKADGELVIDIPEGSRLIVGDKIAAAKAEDLVDLLASFNARPEPLLKTIELTLPEPTLHDNISDLDRLKRALDAAGLDMVRFSHGFTRSMAHSLRKPSWNVTLGYYEDLCFREAVFIKAPGHGRLGVAVDIGTTTVVAYLVDMLSGRVLDVGSTYNSQMRMGDDVITRIVHATETPESAGLYELREAVVSDINDIILAMTERRGVAVEDIETITIAGNTTMSQLFWGLDPGSIREEPYIPTLNSFPLWKARAGRLKANTEAPVYTLPCVASYVGGDIVAGVLASKMHRQNEAALFMDIGTNGEIALGNDEWLVAAACSAGPCFEGSGIRHGMRATSGAIEGIRIDPNTLEPEIKVIGGGRPRGICGSGMIDAICEMFLVGLLDQKGRFVPEKTGGRLRQGEEGPEYVFHEDGQGVVCLTEVDIENIIRAKAAIYAGVSLLVTEMGLALGDIQKVYIAGGFGNYLNIEKAIVLGMLPDLPLERFRFLGNTSVAGAYLALLSPEMRAEAEGIASRMTYMELSVSRGFMDEYMSAMFLPHTDLSQFPTVAGRIGKA